MQHLQSFQSSSKRNLQIKKLLEAIANYSPDQEDLFSMKQAKQQMLRNIQRKYKNAHTNYTYKFPYNKIKDQTQQQNQHWFEEIPFYCNQTCNLYDQSYCEEQKNIERIPLEQKINNFQILDIIKKQNQIDNKKDGTMKQNRLIKSQQNVKNMIKNISSTQKENQQNDYNNQRYSKQVFKKQFKKVFLSSNIPLYKKCHKKVESKQEIWQRSAKFNENKSNQKQLQDKVQKIQQEKHNRKENKKIPNKEQKPGKNIIKQQIQIKQNLSNLRSKLKIKSHSTLESTLLKTQNNVNHSKDIYFYPNIQKQLFRDQFQSHQLHQQRFKQNHNYQDFNFSKQTFINGNFTQGLIKKEEIILQERSQQESLFFNSKCNQYFDQQIHFQSPKKVFNVSDLKQKLRQTSKQRLNNLNKKHKRTATEGDMDIKIKLFSNTKQKMKDESKIKNVFKKKEIAILLFERKDQIDISKEKLMNRTLSSLGRHSTRKGIKICSKSKREQQKQREESESREKRMRKSQSKQVLRSGQVQKRLNNQIKDNKAEIKNKISHIKRNDKEIGKKEVKNYTVYLKSSLKEGKKRREDEGMNKEVVNKEQQKQNIKEGNNRSCKISSIMQSLKEGYKNRKKGSKSRSKCGIKTTICV